MKTLADAPVCGPAESKQAVVAFIHVEPEDVAAGNSTETKLVKNAKWLARKWDTKQIILHSFTHLAEAKAEPQQAKAAEGVSDFAKNKFLQKAQQGSSKT
jgi:hypothetical protein